LGVKFNKRSGKKKLGKRKTKQGERERTRFLGKEGTASGVS